MSSASINTNANSDRPKTSHVERTATQPRSAEHYLVAIRDVTEVNSSVRLFRLEMHEEKSIEFRPGQWLDTFVPGIPKAGGFTITSTPAQASLPRQHHVLTSSPPEQRPGAPGECGVTSPEQNQQPTSYPYLELAIQNSPSNPAAAYLFRPINDLIGQTLRVRVGGSFVFPHSVHSEGKDLKKVIFVAGGVGINPLISMVSHLAEHQGRLPAVTMGGDPPELRQPQPAQPEVHFFYSTKLPAEAVVTPAAGNVHRRRQLDPSKVLFLERLTGVFASGKIKGTLRLFFTGDAAGALEDKTTAMSCDNDRRGFAFENRRIGLADVEEVLGPANEEGKRDSAAVYVCGVPAMTDYFVEKLTTPKPEGLGMDRRHVLCEKWW